MKSASVMRYIRSETINWKSGWHTLAFALARSIAWMFVSIGAVHSEILMAGDPPQPIGPIWYGGATPGRPEVGPRPPQIPSTYLLYFNAPTPVTELLPNGGGAFVFGTTNLRDAINYAYMKSGLNPGGHPTVYQLPNSSGWELPQTFGHDIDLPGTYVYPNGALPVVQEFNLPNGRLTQVARSVLPRTHDNLLSFHLRNPNVLPSCRDLGGGMVGSMAGGYIGRQLGGDENWGNVGSNIGGMGTEFAIGATVAKGSSAVRGLAGLRAAGLWATPINAALEAVDAAGALPQWAGGTGMGVLGWSGEIDFRRETLPTGSVGSYFSSAFNSFSHPVRSLWTVGEGGVETVCILGSEMMR